MATLKLASPSMQTFFTLQAARKRAAAGWKK